MAPKSFPHSIVLIDKSRGRIETQMIAWIASFNVGSFSLPVVSITHFLSDPVKAQIIISLMEVSLALASFLNRDSSRGGSIQRATRLVLNGMGESVRSFEM